MSGATRILGIDPGMTGGIALLDTSSLAAVEVHDMPTVHKAVDPAALAALIRELRPDLAVVEEVGPQPRDGVIQAFSFGQSYATARVACLLLDVPVHLVRPQAWKAYFRLRGGPEGKEMGRGLALRRFPASAKSFGLKKHHNRAEAALLALYGREKLLAPTPSPSATGVPD